MCICVLVLRYRPSAREKNELSYLDYFQQNKEVNVFKKIFWPVSVECDRKSSNLVNMSISAAVVLIIALSFILNYSKDLLAASCVVPSVIIAVLILTLCVIIRLQPQNKHIDTFKVTLMDPNLSRSILFL